MEAVLRGEMRELPFESRLLWGLAPLYGHRYFVDRRQLDAGIKRFQNNESSSLEKS